MNLERSEVELRLKSIIDTAIDGIITISSRGIMEMVNQSAADLFELTVDEMIGQNVSKLMGPADESHHDGYLKKYQETKKGSIIGSGRDVVGKKKSGLLFPLRLAVSEVKLTDRTIYTGILHDLTEIKNTEKQLREINVGLEAKVESRTVELEIVVNRLLSSNKKMADQSKQLEAALAKEIELNKLKSRFVSMASHEFRTPLSTIMSSAGLIKLYKLEENQDKREKHVLRIKSAVNNLTGILNDFLSLGKLEEGKTNVKIEVFNLPELCEKTFSDLKGIQKSGQRIKLKTENIDLLMQSDYRILRNILLNILSNAVKYSGDDSLIECELIEHEKEIEIAVSDNGIGIPASEQKYLFDRFFRASNVETIQGTGLGLNIVGRYLNIINGRISFESKEGVGSTFIIKLPRNYE